MDNGVSALLFFFEETIADHQDGAVLVLSKKKKQNNHCIRIQKKRTLLINMYSNVSEATTLVYEEQTEFANHPTYWMDRELTIKSHLD